MGIGPVVEWETDQASLLCSRVDQEVAEVNDLKRAFQGFKHHKENAVSDLFMHNHTRVSSLRTAKIIVKVTFYTVGSKTKLVNNGDIIPI